MSRISIGAALLLASCTTMHTPPTRAGAIATANSLVKVGEAGDRAIGKLSRAGFRCRQLASHEYASFHPEPIKVMSCFTEADKTAEGYSLVYASLTIDRVGQVVEMHVDWYPVIYRNLRKDAEGRTIVVRDGQ